MKTFILLSFLILGACAFPGPKVAAPCDSALCQLPDCRCSSTETPGGIEHSQTPQFVMLTFDDAVAITNIDYYNEALDGRTNPDNCPISATFYVSHEYTDYTRVHSLHARGHEIALHSISHTSEINYWRDATVELLEQEILDQKIIMEHFAKIPPSDIKGLRMPFLQMAGNNQFEMISDSDLLYDCSWSTRENMLNGMWPYSLRYRSTQDCTIPPCPTESFPNAWVVPMTQWNNDNENHTCSMADACISYLDNDFEWMRREFLRHYDSNRAPFGFFLHAAWFQPDERRFEAYINFLNYLSTLPDVFIVSTSQVIDWVRNPRPVSQMTSSPSCSNRYEEDCVSRACQLLNPQGNERWLWNCAAQCPSTYPWLGNPLGEAQEP